MLSGQVTLLDRRWRTQLVYAGRTYRTNIGRIVIDATDELDAAQILDHDAVRAGKADADEVRAALRGAWTHSTLEVIAAQPATRAADLAAGLGRETGPFKLDVRKLKNLGLTYSLEVGYRLAPRGEAYLRWLT